MFYTQILATIITTPTAIVIFTVEVSGLGFGEWL